MEIKDTPLELTKEQIAFYLQCGSQELPIESLTHFKCHLKECGQQFSIKDAPADQEMWACPWCGTWHTYPNKVNRMSTTAS